MSEKAKSKSKVKHRLKFRFSIIFLSFLLSFMLCFIAYVKGIREKEAEISPVINRNLVSGSENETSQANIIDNETSQANIIDNESSQKETTYNELQTEAVETGMPTAVDQTVSNPVAECARKDDTYLQSCAFVGDSISTGFSGYGFVSEKNVLAKTSMRIDLINNTPFDTYYGEVLAVNALKAANLENIYIMLGSNGMGWIDNISMIESYSTFVENIQSALPKANIYIMSIPPVTAEREQKPTVEEGKILNSTINEYNALLLELANEKNVHFIDVHSAVVNEQGMLPSEVSSDGMHFTKDTYVKIVDYILTHVAD
ncbi:MAG: GDSL-type esterase/lipase family protein [Oscillospiraceae bacterium]